MILHWTGWRTRSLQANVKTRFFSKLRAYSQRALEGTLDHWQKVRSLCDWKAAVPVEFAGSDAKPSFDSTNILQSKMSLIDLQCFRSGVCPIGLRQCLRLFQPVKFKWKNRLPRASPGSDQQAEVGDLQWGTECLIWEVSHKDKPLLSQFFEAVSGSKSSYGHTKSKLWKYKFSIKSLLKKWLMK